MCELIKGLHKHGKVMKNTHRMGGKLDTKWTGPYEVIEKLSKGRYCLKKDGKTLEKLYNGALLKDHLQPKSTNISLL